jgi:MFS family permease
MAEPTAQAAPARAAGTFAPLRQPVFAVLWAATVLGNIGSFMRDVASSWLVTDLSASPTAVALIQTAATLPIFLLAIPAGVLSDILDRRRFLIFVQFMLAGVSGTLLVLSPTGTMSVASLVGLTFLGGIGAALMGPTWQSIVPELVPREGPEERGGAQLAGHQHRPLDRAGAGGLLLAASARR